MLLVRRKGKNRLKYLVAFRSGCLGALFVCLGFLTASASEWDMQADSSSVRFIGVQEGSAFRGRFEDFFAMVSFDPASFDEGRIVGSVQVASVNSGDQERDSTLLDQEWFDPGTHPVSQFESDQIQKLEDGTFQAHGQLTLRGVTNPVTMDFSFETSDSGAQLSGSFEIRRLDFGVGWPATNWVDDEVSVQVELDLR